MDDLFFVLLIKIIIFLKIKMRKAERAEEKGMEMDMQVNQLDKEAEIGEFSGPRKEYKERLKAVRTKLKEQRKQDTTSQGWSLSPFFPSLKWMGSVFKLLGL